MKNYELINDNEEVKALLSNYIAKSRKIHYKLVRFFYYYKRSFFLIIFVLIVSLMLLLLIILSGFIISRVTEIFSVAALILSLTGILYRMMYLKEYAVKELIIQHLKEDLYEIDFMIKNAGFGKLRLDFAFYSIENKDFDNINDFFRCTSMEMGEYFTNLLNKLDSTPEDEMELYLLNNILKERGMFYTHEGFNTERRLKIFKPNRLYKITFFFQTSKKVNYEISKYVIT
ncbi:MAG: hypothetical protein BAJALOKI3v1_850006 [Promethearchaeota archaeon]|nr:MAG: hypothetical protein BAJALOKI3v1_850006 [Candidatus Lokiarchaeota archaeon]